MGKRIIRNADLLKKAQEIKYAAESQTIDKESTAPETKIPTIKQINDICSYVPTCQDDWNNKDWNNVCTESDYKEFIEIIQPFCTKNPDFEGCDDCL